VIVLVGINAFDDVVFFEVKSYQFVKYYNIDWYLGQSNKNSTNYSVKLLRTVPWVPSNVLDTVSHLWIGLENISYHVFRIVTGNFRDCILTIKYFFVQICGIRILKRQVSTNKSK